MQELRKFRVAVVLCLIFTVLEVASDTYYSSFYGLVLSSTDVTAYTSNGTLANCTNLVAACNSSEPRRLDGSCNNLNYPVRGATRTPQFTFLPKLYNKTSSTVFDPKLSVSGEPLKSARLIRDMLIADGTAEDSVFTTAVTHFLVFFATDMTNTRDTTNYLSWRPYCCEEAGKSDYMCAPNLVPQDDYVHRFSNIKCLNMTRPLTFQTSGCVANTTTPTRIVDATPSLDMSPIYGNAVEPARRTYVNGTLATETVDNRTFPLSNISGLLLGINYIPIIYYWRLHNHIAGELIKVNPCWSDNKTFSIAREINIAYGCQITYYELMPELMGTDNLIDAGVISNSTSFRDTYNSSLSPAVGTDVLVGLRYLHKAQEGKLKFYASNGTLLNTTFPLVNLTTNLAFIKQNSVMDYVTRSCITQPCGKFNDNIADPDILNMGLGSLQKAMDIMTNDLAKNRYYGLNTYVAYRNFCFGDNITSFDDLQDIIYPEMIGTLQYIYGNVSNMDMLAGLWTELPMDGGYLPPTLYCLVTKQLLHNMNSDRHWYERSTRPNAFTADQLTEIRKMTIARVFCDVGDAVTKVQPRAFVLPGSCNEVVSCDDIPQIDYSVWADSSCNSTSS